MYCVYMYLPFCNVCVTCTGKPTSVCFCFIHTDDLSWGLLGTYVLFCKLYVLYFRLQFIVTGSQKMTSVFMKVHRSTLNDVNQLYPSSKACRSTGILNIAIITKSVSIFSYCF